MRCERLAASGAQQAIQQRVNGTFGFIKTADGGYRALARFALFIAEGLDELRVAVAAGAALQSHELPR